MLHNLLSMSKVISDAVEAIENGKDGIKIHLHVGNAMFVDAKSPMCLVSMKKHFMDREMRVERASRFE